MSLPSTRAVDVSVLVPLRNEQDRMQDAVAAMLDQRFDGQVEFLFLDGGSTDLTLAELTRISESDQRVVLVRQAGATVPAQLNLGLRLARGDVIARMDTHALFPPNYLADGVDR